MIQKLNSDSKPSLLELSMYTGQLESDSAAAINYPFLFAALTSWMTEVGTDFHKIVSDFKLGPLIGDGFMEWGPIKATSYPTDLRGIPWQPYLVSPHSTGKKAFSESFIGVLMGLLILFTIKTVGLRAAVVNTGSVYKAVKTRAFRERLFSELDSAGKVSAPPSSGDLSAIQLGLADLLQGMQKDNRKLLARGHKRLVPKD